MARYNTKVIDFNYKEKVLKYSTDIVYNTNSIDSGLPRRNYKNMSDQAKALSDKRRLNYYKHKLYDITEIALMNPDLDTMITLTFRHPVTSYDIALEEWKLFIKRLQYHCKKTGKLDLKYIAVWEYQKKRGNVFHFHFLSNTGYIEHKTLEKLWGNGFVFISKIGKSEQDRRKAIGYTLKYCLKEIIDEVESGGSRGKRYILTSNNLEKPTERKFLSEKTIDNIIFEHMENMLSDGQYYRTDDKGRKVGIVDFVEYKK